MRNLKFTTETLLRLQVSTLTLLLLPLIVAGQVSNGPSQKASTSFTGKYEGVVKGPNGDVKVLLELRDEAAKYSGRVTTPNGVYELTKSTLADGLLTVEFDAKGMLAKFAVRQKETKLVGNWWLGDQTGAFELSRVADKDEISGDWDAVADAGGQNFPFTLTLKVEGDKLTGGSSSDLGTSTISEGTLKDGKLVFKLIGSAGTIAMIASMQEGKLVGDFDYNGQMQGRWVAVKRK